MAEGRRIIKKKPAAHPHHGGAWKVAYADFVTAMMALFMVMWLLASTDQQSRLEISRYFRTGILPEGDMAMQRAAQKKPSVIEDSTMAAPRKGPQGEDDAKALGKAIKTLINSDPELAKLAAQVSITETKEGLLIEAVDRDGQSMLFDLASSELKPALIAFLAKLGPMLAARGNKVRVMGHTDARPLISRTKTNWDLSYERASNARRALEGSGLMTGQIDAVQAHGASQPRNPADPYAAENRRLSFLVLNPPAPAEAADGANAPGSPASPTRPTTEPAAPAAIPAPVVAPAAPTHAGATPTGTAAPSATAAAATTPAAPTPTASASHAEAAPAPH